MDCVNEVLDCSNLTYLHSICGTSRDCTAEHRNVSGPMDSPSSTRQPVMSNSNSNSKRRVPVKQGNTSRQNATAKAPKRKRKQRQTRRLPAWLASLEDPCNVKDVRIPDGQMFPTATGQIRIVKVFTGTAGYRQVIGACPADLVVRPADSDAFSAFHWSLVSPDDATPWPSLDIVPNNKWRYGIVERSTPPYSDLVALMKNARVVSSCIKATYTGAAIDNGGTITGWELPREMFVGNVTNSTFYSPDGSDLVKPYFVATPSGVRNLANTRIGPLRDGMEVLKVPTGRGDLHFADGTATGSIGIEAGYTTVSETGTFGLMIDWTSASQQITVEYVVNFEYQPYAFAQASTRTVPMQPSVISQVASLTQHVSNFIRPLAPYARPALGWVADRVFGREPTYPTITEL